MRYIFQESLIWDGAGRVDTDKKPVSVKAKSEEKARRRLPKNSSMGRSWILIGTEE